MARRIAADHAAGLHQRLGREDAALAVFIVDQRQPARVLHHGLFAIAGVICIDDLADTVRVGAARHRAGGTGIEIGQERDRFLAIPRAFDGRTADADQLAHLAGRLRHFQLEVLHLLDVLRHAGEQCDRQRRTGHRRVLDHDGDADRVRQALVEGLDLRLGHAEGGAVIRRHHHHHGGAELLRLMAAGYADLGAVVRGGHDHRHASRHMAEDGAGQRFPFGVREHELLGEIGEDAQARGAGVDHEIDAAQLAGQVERAGLVKNGRHDREDALVRASGQLAHDADPLSRWEWVDRF